MKYPWHERQSSIREMTQPEESRGRRSVLRGAAFSAAGLTAGLFTGPSMPAAAATTASSWVSVPPGKSINAALEKGARAVALDAGDYPVHEPIVLPPGCQLRGAGSLTRLRATSTLPTVIAIGNGGSAYGVMVADLAIDCARHAAVAIDLNIVGTEGNWNGDNDAACRLEDLWIWAPESDGVAYRGTDNRAVVSTRVRVRQAGRYGFRIGESDTSTASDCWWVACEATTIHRTGSSAGFLIHGSNNFFQACKAWYCRDYGFHVRGTRNNLVGCGSQDTRSHGFFVEWPKNLFTGCSADTAGMWDVGGEPDSADGFHVRDGSDTSIVGCQAFDRGPQGHRPQQRYGFNVPGAMVTENRLVGQSGWDNTGGLVHRR